MYGDREDDMLTSTSREVLEHGASNTAAKLEGIKKDVDRRQTLKDTSKDREHLDTSRKLGDVKSDFDAKTNPTDKTQPSAGKKSEETKRKEKKEKEYGSKTGVKTIEQELKSKVQSGSSKESAQDKIDQEEQKLKAEEDNPIDQQAQMG